MTKAIVFDIGGVLINLDLKAGIRTFKERLGFDRITEILDPFHQKGIYGDMEGGIISADDFRNAVLTESRPGSTAADVDYCVRSLLTGISEDTAAAVKSVIGRYPLYILSNTNAIADPYCLELFDAAGFGGCFQERFLSFEMKMLKPQKEIFLEVIRRIGLEPGEILYIDDSSTNVDAARALGIDARLLEPGQKLSSLMP